MFHAGEATNVIPDAARLAGTIRDLNPGVVRPGQGFCAPAAFDKAHHFAAASENCAGLAQIVSQL
jgi:hypothetical protein